MYKQRQQPVGPDQEGEVIGLGPEQQHLVVLECVAILTLCFELTATAISVQHLWGGGGGREGLVNWCGVGLGEGLVNWCGVGLGEGLIDW